MKPGQFPATPLWWEIAYAGGERVRGASLAEWVAARANGVVAVRQPVAQTYQTTDGEFHFTVRVAGNDYYWLDSEGLIQSGQAPQAAEADAPDGAMKRGAWEEDDAFAAVIHEFWQDVSAD